MSFVPYPKEEAHKSELLLQAALFRAEGHDELSAARFAEAGSLEEWLADRAEAEGDTSRAMRSRFSAASAFANAGDFHHALTLLQALEHRTDAPESLRTRVHTFAESVRNQRRHWQHTLQEASLV